MEFISITTFFVLQSFQKWTNLTWGKKHSYQQQPCLAVLSDVRLFRCISSMCYLWNPNLFWVLQPSCWTENPLLNLVFLAKNGWPWKHFLEVCNIWLNLGFSIFVNISVSTDFVFGFGIDCRPCSSVSEKKKIKHYYLWHHYFC